MSTGHRLEAEKRRAEKKIRARSLNSFAAR